MPYSTREGKHLDVNLSGPCSDSGSVFPNPAAGAAIYSVDLIVADQRKVIPLPSTQKAEPELEGRTGVDPQVGVATDFAPSAES